MELENMIYIYTDGGSRGNPGPAAIGVYIIDSNSEVLYALGETIGETTNNVAEYTAVIAALSWLVKNKKKLVTQKVHFRLDSLLVVSQINGLYKIKHSHLRDLMIQVRTLMGQLDVLLNFEHIPREKNKMADALVNRALDNQDTLA